MEKKRSIHGRSLCSFKILRIMKLTIFLMLISFVGVFASETYSQTTKLSLKVEKMSLEKFLAEIENQSEFRFFYSGKIDVEKKVSGEYRNKKVTEILDDIKDETGIQYEIMGRQIVLSPANTENGITSVQQKKAISGKVTDPSGSPLPGVTVVIKGTMQGTVTNIDGEYTVTNIPNNAILVFSFVGMRTQEVEIADQIRIDVTLLVDAIGIEEVVAIGYGTRKKSDLTGAVSTVSSDELTNEVKMSPELSMQGKMAGVYISNPGSDPNSRPTIQIRGVSTLGFNDPLYVIDGIPVYEYGAYDGDESRIADLRGDVNILNMINPDDIESISVLKDASATAIYGVRASNGVILINTKRGSRGKINISFSGSVGVQNINKRYDVLSVEDYVDLMNEGWDNYSDYTPDSDITRYYDESSAHYLGDLPNNNWMDEGVVKNAIIEDYNVNVSGGNAVSNYSVGAGYAYQDNAKFSSSFERYSFFLNSDHNLTKWLKVGESYRFVYSKSNLPMGASISDMTFAPPWQPLYDEDGLHGLAVPGRTVDGEFISYGYGEGTRSNFLADQYYTKNISNLYRNLGTFNAEISPFKGLRIKGTISFDRYTNMEESYSEDEVNYFYASYGYLLGTENTYSRRGTVNTNLVKELLIGYNQSFGKHNIDLVLNAMDQNLKWEVDNLSVSDNSSITSWDQRYIDEGLDGDDTGVFYERVESGLQGYMGRLSYNYDRRYYLDATVRRDGSSHFAPDYKWGTFPSFAVAWRVSSEPFMQDLVWLDDLKIRSGWGQTGNQETGSFAYLSLLNTNPVYSLGSTTGSGTLTAASALSNFPVVDLSWETVNTSNLGFDAILLDNKLAFTAEYYFRHTEGILQEIDIPLVVGVTDNPTVNLAEVNNSGFEFQVNYSNKIGPIDYNVSVNLTTVKNEVKSLYLDKPSTDSYMRIEEGYSMNYIYGYKMEKIFQSEEEVAEWKSQYTDTGYDSQKSSGDIGFMDLYGAPADDAMNTYKTYEPDGTINSYDQTYLGKTIPGYFYGFSLNLKYKNWDMSSTFRGVGDVQKINYIKWAGETMNSGGTNMLASTLNRWTSTNPSTTMPRAVAEDPTGNTRFSDRWVEDGDFLRLQNLQVGYNFKNALLRQYGINNLRCYVSGSNLFVITLYSGLDPENDTTPVTFIVGVNLNF